MNRSRPESELFIEYALRRTKGRVKVIGFVHAALLILAAVVLYVLGAVVADHVSGGLATGTRAAARWVLAACVTGLAGWMIVAPLLRRINDLYVARMIERAHPEFRNDLTVALELRKTDGAQPGILAALWRRATHELADSEFEQAVSTRLLRTSGIMLAAAAAVFVLYAAVSPKPVLPSLLRVFGNDSLAAPTRTQITDISPPDGETVMTAQDVAFAATIVNADTARVELRAGESLETLAMAELLNEPPPGAGRRFGVTWRARSSTAGVVFRVVAGDAASAWFALDVLPVPVIRRQTALVHWPAYTGRGDRESDGPVEALEGSVVDVQAEINLPLDRATLRLARGDVLRLAVDGNVMSGPFTVKGDDKYRVEFFGMHPLVRGESIDFPIQSLTDAPPAVVLTEPADRVELCIDDALRLSCDTSDDYGLADATLVVRATTERRIELATFTTPGPTMRRIEATIPASQLGREGQTLVCHIAVRDHKPPAGQTTTSRAFEVALTAPNADRAAQARAAAEAQARQAEQARDTANPPDRPPGHTANAMETPAGDSAAARDGATPDAATNGAHDESDANQTPADHDVAGPTDRHADKTATRTDAKRPGPNEAGAADKTNATNSDGESGAKDVNANDAKGVVSPGAKGPANALLEMIEADQPALNAIQEAARDKNGQSDTDPPKNQNNNQNAQQAQGQNAQQAQGPNAQQAQNQNNAGPNQGNDQGQKTDPPQNQGQNQNTEQKQGKNTNQAQNEQGQNNQNQNAKQAQGQEANQTQGQKPNQDQKQDPAPKTNRDPNANPEKNAGQEKGQNAGQNNQTKGENASQSNQAQGQNAGQDNQAKGESDSQNNQSQGENTGQNNQAEGKNASQGSQVQGQAAGQDQQAKGENSSQSAKPPAKQPPKPQTEQRQEEEPWHEEPPEEEPEPKQWETPEPEKPKVKPPELSIEQDMQQESMESQPPNPEPNESEGCEGEGGGGQQPSQGSTPSQSQGKMGVGTGMSGVGTGPGSGQNSEQKQNQDGGQSQPQQPGQNAQQNQGGSGQDQGQTQGQTQGQNQGQSQTSNSEQRQPGQPPDAAQQRPQQPPREGQELVQGTRSGAPDGPVRPRIAGGNPNSGSSDRRGEVNADNEFAALTPAQRAKLDAVGRAIDHMAQDIRAGSVDPDLLEKLDMSPEQFSQFVETYRQKFDQLRARRPGEGQTTIGTGRTNEAQETTAVDRGRGRNGALRAGGTDPRDADDLRKLNERKLQNVSPDFRREVEAYFRAVSESSD